MVVTVWFDHFFIQNNKDCKLSCKTVPLTLTSAANGMAATGTTDGAAAVTSAAVAMGAACATGAASAMGATGATGGAAGVMVQQVSQARAMGSPRPPHNTNKTPVASLREHTPSFY